MNPTPADSMNEPRPARSGVPRFGLGDLLWLVALVAVTLSMLQAFLSALARLENDLGPTMGQQVALFVGWSLILLFYVRKSLGPAIVVHLAVTAGIGGLFWILDQATPEPQSGSVDLRSLSALFALGLGTLLSGPLGIVTLLDGIIESGAVRQPLGLVRLLRNFVVCLGTSAYLVLLTENGSWWMIGLGTLAGLLLLQLLPHRLEAADLEGHELEGHKEPGHPTRTLKEPNRTPAFPQDDVGRPEKI